MNSAISNHDAIYRLSQAAAALDTLSEQLIDKDPGLTHILALLGDEIEICTGHVEESLFKVSKGTLKPKPEDLSPLEG